MERRIVILLMAAGLLLVAAPLLLLAAEHNISYTYSLDYNATWSAELPPTYYYTYSLAPTVQWAARPLPYMAMEYGLSPSATWATLPYISILTYLGDTVEIEQVSGIAPIELDQYFWDGGVAISTPYPATARIYTNRTLLSIGACSLRRISGGYELNLTGGRCIVGEKVWYGVVDLIDPQGFTKYGIKVLVNGSPVIPGVLYTLPGHTCIHVELENAEMGSVYVNDRKVGVGPITVRLANATEYRIRIVVKGKMEVVIESLEFKGTADYIRMILVGMVRDATYGAAVEGAEVRAYLNGAYAGYAFTNGTGYFLIDTMVRKPEKPTVDVKVVATHDDYETAETVETAALPREVMAVPPAPTLWEFAVAAAVAALVAGGVTAAVATAVLRARKRRKKEYFVREAK